MKYWFSLCFIFIFSFGYGQKEEGFAPVGKYQLHYKMYKKKGKPILLINGGPGFSSNYLDDLAKQLSKDMKRTVVFFDPRGTGQSKVHPISKRTVNLKNQVSDIDALREYLGIKKWDVIGHAYGGAIAMLYVHKYPENVNKLVLSSSIGANLDFVDPMLSNLKVRLSVKRAEELSELAQKNLEGQLSGANFYKQRFDLLVDAYVFDKTKIEEARNMIQLDSDYNLHVNQLLWDEMKNLDFNIESKVEEIKKKVLLLHGHQDIIGESVPLHLHDLFPNSKIIFINEAGRYLWLDQPELYFQYLEEFLK